MRQTFLVWAGRTRGVDLGGMSLSGWYGTRLKADALLAIRT
jgi:hypothetical protein